MSSRVLKKLQSELQQKNVVENDDDEYDHKEESLKEGNEKTKKQNIFELLNEQNVSDSDSNEDNSDMKQTSSITAKQSGSSNATKKKKRKKKNKVKMNRAQDKNEIPKCVSNKDILLNKVTEAAQTSAMAKPSNCNTSLLSIELKHLDYQNEMRRTFGKRVVKLDNNKRARHIKTPHIIRQRGTWPPLMKNIISMKITVPLDTQVATTSQSSSTDCGYNNNNNNRRLQWFEFDHSAYYQRIQNKFFAAVGRTDIDTLIHLTWRCPHHIDSLIQLSELCKVTENNSLAAELIERAVLVLESSLHPNFSFTNGNSRLDYRRQTNRGFFIALFKHAQYLEALGCSRTALEVSKLILNLNPEVDPLAMVLIMDFYALRSKQYKWLIDFYEEFDAMRNVSQLPNMAYSYALAMFSQNGENEASNKALQYALLMFPGVLRPLLTELSVQTDKRVVDNSYFNSDLRNTQTPALSQLVSLYVHRAKNLWRDNDVLHWLEQNVNVALDRIDNKDDVINEYNTKRATRYSQPPLPVLRHIVLSDFKEKVPLAQFVPNKDDIVTFDPLPPKDSVDFYIRKPKANTPKVSTADNQVSTFFQSMLPSFNINTSTRQQLEPQELHQQNVPEDVMPQRNNANNVDDDYDYYDEEDDDDEDEYIEIPPRPGNSTHRDTPVYRELTQSLNNVVEAMRNLFHNIRVERGESEDSASENIRNLE